VVYFFITLTKLSLNIGGKNMSMQSEIAIENTVQSIVAEIKKELSVNTDPEACKALKKVGIFALKQFEWSTPEWAGEYEELFKE
jgi:hypothetical protein